MEVTNTNMEKVVVIYGPTGCGKTRLALDLGKERNGEIISVDSRQIYRHMSIGTGKISVPEMQGIPHYGLDLVDPNETHSAAKFAVYARGKISEITARGRLPILCGGTGLYLDAILYDLDVPSFQSDPGFQRELEDFRQIHGNIALWERLRAIDPLYASELHPNSYPYVMRGIEVMEKTGTSKRDFRSVRTPLYDIEWVTPYDGDRENLYTRINARVAAMFEAGWEREFDELITKGYSVNDPGLGSIGYREIAQVRAGLLRPEALREKVMQLTRNYAKRQITWGRTRKK